MIEDDRAMKRQARLDWEQESARLKAVQNQQVSLQRPVGIEVQQEIKKKRSSFKKVLSSGAIPIAVSILAAIVGIPPGVTELLTGWFTDSGCS